ncbi:MAG TPA: ABC transporter ATP-binding protein [Catenuloplanes sp.]
MADPLIPGQSGDRLVLSAVRHGGAWTALFAVASVLGAATELVLPLLLGGAVDALLGQSEVRRWLIAAVAAVLLIAAADALEDWSAGMASARATAALRSRLSRHMLALDLTVARRYQPGDLVARLATQSSDAGQAAIPAVRAATTAIPTVGSLAMLTVIDVWLGVTFGAGLALLGVLLRRHVRDGTDAALRYQSAQADIADAMVEALAGARTIAAAATAEREITRVLKPLPDLGLHGRRAWRALARSSAGAAVVAPLLHLSIVAVGGGALAVDRISPGQLLAALQYAALGAGLGAIVAVLNQLTRVRAGCRRVVEVLAAPVRRYGTGRLPAGPGRLVLNDVTVRAGRAVLLDRVTLTVPGGSTVAVVGHSGAGKSTFAAVAARLIEPEPGGAVTLDGVALAALSRRELRRAVGVAFERPHLLGDTVADAIASGQPDPTPQTVRAAARAARMDTVIDRLPDRYDTAVKDIALSGGELQRLGLARASHAGRLLVLDDATSSLDTVTEYDLERLIVGRADRRTRLVVTHRASTASRADLVVWLVAGRLRGYGPHRVLWRRRAYRALFQPGRAPVGGTP